MKSDTALMVVAGVLALATPALGQMGMGRGMGGGIGGGIGSGTAGIGGYVDSNIGPTKYYGFNQNNVIGWQLMSPEERTAHGIKMRGITTYDECVAYQSEHNKTMESRAREQGTTLYEVGNNACDRMNAKGFFK